jgi:hypothetical protein
MSQLNKAWVSALDDSGLYAISLESNQPDHMRIKTQQLEFRGRHVVCLTYFTLDDLLKLRDVIEATINSKEIL